MSEFRIMISGGAGFIGRHLATYAINNGGRVLVLDNLSGSPNYSPPTSIEFFRADVRDFEKIREIIADWRPQAIVHLAGIASLSAAAQDARTAFDVNVGGTLNMLLAWENYRQPGNKFIFASTAAVYNADKVVSPASWYGQTKFLAEQILPWHAEPGDNIICRFFNVYGPGQNPNSQYSGVITRFFGDGSKNKRLRIYGDGEQTRDFIYVEDIARILLFLAQTDKIIRQPLEIGTGKQTSILKLAKRVREILGGEIGLEFFPALPGEVRYSVADVSKLSEMGLDFAVNVEDGLNHIWSSLSSQAE